MPGDDQFGQRFRRKKLLQEISRLSKGMNNKRVALVKTLSLCRIVDPMNFEGKRKVLEIRNKIAAMCNGQLDQESKRKLLDICGIDSFDHNDPSGFIKQNMYKEFLYSIQMKGVKLAKDFRQHGIPYVQRLDTYVKGIEDPVYSDPMIFRKGREDSPPRSRMRNSPPKGSRPDRRRGGSRDSLDNYGSRPDGRRGGSRDSLDNYGSRPDGRRGGSRDSLDNYGSRPGDGINGYGGPWSRYPFDPMSPVYGPDGLPYNPQHSSCPQREAYDDQEPSQIYTNYPYSPNYPHAGPDGLPYPPYKGPYSSYPYDPSFPIIGRDGLPYDPRTLPDTNQGFGGSPRRSLYPNSREQSRSKGRSVSPEVQMMDDDYLADSMAFYNEDPNVDFIADLGDRKDLTRDAARYDTADLNIDVNPIGGVQSGLPDDPTDDYVQRMEARRPKEEPKVSPKKPAPPLPPLEPEIIIKEIQVEVIREVPVEVIREVEVEVIKEVPYEVIKEVPYEVRVEVPYEVHPPPTPQADMNTSCTDLILEEPVPELPPKKLVADKETSAEPEPTPKTDLCMATDTKEVFDQSMITDLKEVFDKEIGTDVQEFAEAEGQTDEIVVEKPVVAEIECQTDVKVVSEFGGGSMGTDPEAVKLISEVGREAMLTDPEAVKLISEVGREAMLTDPEAVKLISEVGREAMLTDPEAVKLISEFGAANMVTDPEQVTET
jgi:hypothetical protein